MAGTPIDPSFEYAPVVPSDTAPVLYHGVPTRAKGFYVVTSGNLAIKDDKGTAVTFTGLLQGAVYPFGSDYVMNTNTTGSYIALF